MYKIKLQSHSKVSKKFNFNRFPRLREYKELLTVLTDVNFDIIYNVMVSVIFARR